MLETFEQEKGIVDTRVEMSEVMEETEADTSLSKLIMLASIQRTMNEYVSIVKES